MKSSFMKSLILHIRYPWTAVCLLIIWLGLAIMCGVMNFSTEEVIWLISGAGVVTLIIALVGFKGQLIDLFAFLEDEVIFADGFDFDTVRFAGNHESGLIRHKEDRKISVF